MNKIEMMLELSVLITKDKIKDHVNEIYERRTCLEQAGLLSNEERFHLTSRIKAKIQDEANEALDAAGGTGAIYAATGVGKTKMAINRMKKLMEEEADMPAILIAVPTEKLRDEGWKEEFEKWGMSEEYGFVERTCYASLDNYKNQEWDMVVLDEAHNITENNSKFFFENNNKTNSIIALTATRPKDYIKTEILSKLKVKPVYTVTLDEAVRLGIVAPYDITIITAPINKKDPYLQFSTKQGHTYTQTEAKRYDYLSRVCEYGSNGFSRINRMRFIYDLRSKTLAAKQILDKIVPLDMRTLIFCGTKNQANQLCDKRYYSKPSKPKGLTDTATEKQHAVYAEKMMKYESELAEYQDDESLDMFRDGLINRLACVDALNEGHNIAEDLDCAFIVQLDSKPLNFIQRIGRVLRFRPDHVGKIIIMCAEETVDREWVNKAVSGLSIANIKWVKIEDVLEGREVIKFSSSR